MSPESQEIYRQPNQGEAYWVLGDLYTLKAVGEQTENHYALVEMLIQPQSGTPLHIHSQEDESFYIQTGTFEFQLGDHTCRATPGTFLQSPKGQMHRFINVGTEPGKLLCWVTPSGLEYFFAEIGIPATEASTSPSPTDLEKITAAAPKYGLTMIPQAQSE